MLNNDKFYNSFISATSELNFTSGDCLTMVILPESFCDDLSKEIKLQERANICDSNNLNYDINITEEYNAVEVKYSITVSKKTKEIHSPIIDRITYKVPYIDRVKIEVSSTDNTGCPSVYIGKTINTENIYNYYFVKKNKDVIIMFQIKSEIQSSNYYGHKMTNAIVTETVYNKDTTEVIGDAYMNPELLAKSEEYGIKCDGTTTYTDFKSLKDIYDFFNKRCEEVFKEGYSKSMTNGTNNGVNDGR